MMVSLVDLAVHVGVIRFITLRPVDGKTGTGIPRVGIEGKLGERQKVDAVPVLDGGEVPVLRRNAHDGGDARKAPARRTHPADVVVPPLEIHVVKPQQRIEDDVRAGAAVEEIAQNVDAVDSEPLDEIAEGDDEVARPLGGDDCGDDAVVVRLLVLHLLLLAEQLLDDIGIVVRELLAHARARILGGDAAVDAHQAVDGRLVPVVEVLLRRLDLGKLLRRIVDERRQRLLLLHGERPLELLLDLLADRARAVLQDVQEGFVFAVDVRDEVLRPLGKVEHGGEVDDLRRRLRRRRKLNGEPFEIFLFLHIHSPCVPHARCGGLFRYPL